MLNVTDAIRRLGNGIADHLGGMLAFAVCLGLASLAHALLVRLLDRLAARSSSAVDDTLVRCFAGPSRLLILCLTALAALPILSLDDGTSGQVRHGLVLVLTGAMGWLFIAAARAVKQIVDARYDVTATDNLRARQVRTRTGILYRIVLALVVVLTACLMLMSFPSVRHVGLTLFASAGIAGLAIGAAAQPALKNLIAGIQLAFTEPIRLDDVVIIEGEWGRIEEIRLTYVVVRIWDDRRLIVPISKFLEQAFQNWTRSTAHLLGTAYFYLDYSVPVDRIRARLRDIVEASPHWDGRTCVVQVTDLKEHTVEVRALVSAANAGDAFDLRCEVRERMIEFIREDFPYALPRFRAELGNPAIEARDMKRAA